MAPKFVYFFAFKNLVKHNVAITKRFNLLNQQLVNSGLNRFLHRRLCKILQRFLPAIFQLTEQPVNARFLHQLTSSFFLLTTHTIVPATFANVNETSRLSFTEFSRARSPNVNRRTFPTSCSPSCQARHHSLEESH